MRHKVNNKERNASEHNRNFKNMISETEKAILEYYQKLDADRLELPRYSSKRQYVLSLGNDFWKKVPDRIDTPEKLKAQLIKRPVYGVYATIGRWLNPTVLRRIIKKKKIINRNVIRNPLLGSDYLVDFDLALMSHKQLTADIYHFIETQGFDDLELIFSGENSQILVHDFYVSNNPDPVDRLLECHEEFKKFTNLLLDKFPVDFDVMNDWPTRVAKLIPNTLSKYGTIVEKIDINKIDSFVPTQIFTPAQPIRPSRIISIKPIYMNMKTYMKSELVLPPMDCDSKVLPSSLHEIGFHPKTETLKEYHRKRNYNGTTGIQLKFAI